MRRNALRLLTPYTLRGLSPYAAINPCGYEGLAVTQCRDVGIVDGLDMLGEKLAEHLSNSCRVQ